VTARPVTGRVSRANLPDSLKYTHLRTAPDEHKSTHLQIRAISPREVDLIMNGETSATPQNRRTRRRTTTTRLPASGPGNSIRLRQMRTRLQQRNSYRKARKEVIARRMLQAYEDAITFRSAQLSEPCPACTGPDRCAEHAQNQTLIWTYQQMHAATLERLHQTARPKPGNLT